MRNKEVYILSKKKSRIRPFNRDMKRWIPSPALQRVFSDTFDACGLDESERDEIRKIYFLWLIVGFICLVTALGYYMLQKSSYG